MTNILTVNVTQDDINNGAKCAARRCPVARALKRELHTSEVSVGTERCTINGRESYQLPLEVQKWTLDFDLEGPAGVKPFSFTIDLDDPRSAAGPVSLT